MYSPTTPVTSRSGYLRGRKRINPHPISQLRKKPMPENDEKTENVDPEDSSIEADTSTELESQDTSTDSGLETSHDTGNESHYSLRKAAKDPF
ncbi:uncharacterized protein LOC120452785 [Drosophila santomea]|uniref:uncharacterized protein LOC120452785 n=1 Tax=Drosophila santomea TaxID=129105 RepID=UPI001953778B|nr:uncharacterized protein LOC120452785 [Drosophila santomea]